MITINAEQAEYAIVSESGQVHVYLNRISAMKEAIKAVFDYVLFFESQARLTNPDTLYHLIQQV